MEVRLVQLLGSFISTTSAYVLARLEYALQHPGAPAPPLIERLPDASETTLRTQWDGVERQLESACRYLKCRMTREENGRRTTRVMRICSARRANSNNMRERCAG